MSAEKAKPSAEKAKNTMVTPGVCECVFNFSDH